MASFLGRFVERALLDYMYGQTAWAITPPATYYVALFSTMPLADGTGGVEISGNNYSRATYTNNGANWPAASSSNPATKANTNTISFPIPSGGGWSNMVGAGMYDASTAGNGWQFGTFPSNISAAGGSTVSISAGSLTLTVA